MVLALQCRKLVRYARRRRYGLVVAFGAVYMTLWFAAEYVSPRDQTQRTYSLLVISAKWTQWNWWRSCSTCFSVRPSICAQSVNRLRRHRCAASVNLLAWYNCFNRNIFDSCVKGWEYFHMDDIVGNDVILAFWRYSQVQDRSEGWGEMYENVNTISDGFSAHARARPHYWWCHCCWHASTVHVHYWVGAYVNV